MACYVIFKIHSSKDFPGGPVVETSPFSSGCVVSVPDQGTKIPHAWCPKNQNIKQKQYYNNFKTLKKKGPHQKNNLKKIHSSAVHLGLKKMLMLYE